VYAAGELHAASPGPSASCGPVRSARPHPAPFPQPRRGTPLAGFLGALGLGDQAPFLATLFPQDRWRADAGSPLKRIGSGADWMISTGPVGGPAPVQGRAGAAFGCDFTTRRCRRLVRTPD